MNFRKVLALCMSVILPILTLIVLTPSVIEAAELNFSTVLFSDDFEQYTQPESGNPIFWGDGSNISVTYDNNYFKYTNYAGVNTEQKNDTYNPFMTEGTLAKHIQFVEGKSVGSGKSMTVTSQGFIDYAGVIKQTNITSEKIDGKKLTFSLDFNVNRMFIGEGYGVWLAKYQNNRIVPDQMENRTIQTATLEEETGKQLLVIAPIVKDGKPQIYALGQRVGEVEYNTEYTYTLELTPDGNGGYTAAAYLNGNILDTVTNNILTMEDVAECKYVMMSPISHKWTIYDRQFGRKPTDDSGNKNYQNDIDIISVDNLSMKATVVGVSAIFNDDFEDYSGNPVNKGQWAKKASNFDGDLFQYQYGDENDFTSNPSYSLWINDVSNGAQDIAIIESDTGVGDGKALKFTGQVGVTNYALAKPSNLDKKDIGGKQLEFHADFKAPTSGIMGEGFGIWVATDDNDGTNDVIRYISSDINLTGNDDYELKKGELMFVGTRRAATVPTAVGARATYLYVFGKEVARLNPDATYDFCLTLVPKETGYKGFVSLNGRVIELDENSLPTCEELATYKRLYVNPLSRAWTMHDLGAMKKTEGRPADAIDTDGMYKMGRTLGIIDNVSMIAVDNISEPVVDSTVNMTAAEYDWTSKGTSFINAYANIIGTTAIIEIYSDRTEIYTPVIVAASYDSDNNMVACAVNKTTDIPALGRNKVIFSGLPKNCTYVKFLIWDTFENITPITMSHRVEMPEPEPEEDVVNIVHSIRNADMGILGEIQYFD